MPDDAAHNPFANAAGAYAESEIHAKGEDLGAIVAYAAGVLGGLEGRRILDVATGAGHTALAFARAGATVAALDPTPEMLQVARRLAAERLERGAVAFHGGRAEALPFDEGAFDAVACRIAAHHFQDPSRFLVEARRVLASDGRLLLIDNVAPEDPELDRVMNRIERERDPSHVRAYTVAEWIQRVVEAGLVPEHLERWRRTKRFPDWIARTGMSDGAARALEAYVLGLPGSARDYFGVRVERNRVATLEHEVVFLAARRRP